MVSLLNKLPSKLAFIQIINQKIYYISQSFLIAIQANILSKPNKWFDYQANCLVYLSLISKFFDMPYIK